MQEQTAQLGLVQGVEKASQLRGRDLLSIADLTPDEIKLVFSTASLLKESVKNRGQQSQLLAHKTLAMIFEKPSLRTRVTFEVGMTQLGGHAIYLQPADIQLGKRETIADAARNLERWLDVIMARVFSHDTVTELAKYARIPVINALSDLEHPCQALADFQTIREHKGELKGRKLAYVGDGNNVCHSLLLLAAKVGTHMSVGCPAGYEPNSDVVAMAKKLAQDTGAVIEVTHDPVEAVKDADAVYTDVWASMGQESEKAEREKVFPPYQVNGELLKHAKPDVIFLHCLPAHRGDEVTDEVMDGPHSVVFDEAENRLHVQKALLVLLVKD
jgi:ornithine carbamoyltransferase